MKKRFLAMAMAVLCVCYVGGCGKQDAQTDVNLETESIQQETETMESGNEAAILMVSFGTSYNDSRDITIGAIEEAVADACPEYEVRRAFTSQIIIDKLKERDGLEIDNVQEALDRAVTDGVKELVVQPTHLMNGYEYIDLAEELTEYLDQFDKIILGEPLLTSDADFDAVVAAITEKTASYDDGETAICFMGHGTEADSNAVYEKLQGKLDDGGYENYYIGTVEAAPTIDDVVAALNEKGTYKKVVLEPLMVVAGDHANNDMAGDEEDSWKTILEQEGYEVECLLEGLGQVPAIQEIYVEHVKSAIAEDVAFTGFASAKEEGTVGELTDGTYSVEVESDSSMFKIVKAELTVDGDSMTAAITLSGTGYAYLYMGTAEEADAAEEAEYIGYTEDAEGAYVYTIPVEALDQPFACAAFSKKKEQWYDRQLTVLSSSIAAGAAEETTTDGATDAAEAGTYQIDVTLEGGSGKSTVLSPATLQVTEDGMIATIEWSSENYDYMIVNDEKYMPVNTEGNSVFEIPVEALDVAIDVIGDTVAMSTPHEIEYTLTFHSDTMKVQK